MVWWKPEIKDEPSPWKDAAVPATNAWAQKAQVSDTPSYLKKQKDL